MTTTSTASKLQFSIFDLLGSMVTICLYMGLGSMLWEYSASEVMRRALFGLGIIWCPLPVVILLLMPRRAGPELSPQVSGLLLGRCCAWAAVLGCLFALVLSVAPWNVWQLTLAGSVLGTGTLWVMGMATLVYLEGGRVAQRPALFDGAAWFYFYLLWFALPGSTLIALWAVLNRSH